MSAIFDKSVDDGKNQSVGCPECGDALTMFCPVCKRKDIMACVTETDLYDRVPEGWIALYVFDGCPPYVVCSEECRVKFEEYLDNTEPGWREVHRRALE
jgi:hypothetical protein